MPEPGKASSPAIQDGAGEGPYPLSPSQERFWFLERLEPGNPAHHVASAVRFTGPLHIAALERALTEVIRRHEPMRTVIRWDADQPGQWILPASRVELRPVDLSALGPAAREDERSRMAEDIATSPFDLARGPVVRFTLLRLAAGEHELLAAAHHVAADGLSAVFFLRELLALYAGLLEGAPPAIPPPTRPFRAFAAEERQRAADPSLQRLISWWADRLSGVPALALPADRPRGTEWRRRGARMGLRLDRDLCASFTAFARRAGVTTFVAGLGACAAWLHRLSGAEDFAIGVPAANRDRPGTESLIGFFVNSLAIRLRPDPERGFDALLSQARTAVAEALDRQEAPFEAIVERLNPERDPGRHPIFQVMFNFVPFVEERLEVAGLVVEPRPLASGTLVDLTLYLRASGESLEVEAEYDQGLFEAATIHRWLACFRTMVHAAIEDPGRPLADLPLLDAGGLALVLAAGDGGRIQAGAESAIEARIARRAAEHPAAMAVSAGDRPLTYRELQDESGRIAAGLADLGVGPGSLVGVAVARSPALIPVLLAVMRRGAAWLPLDLRMPRDRLAILIEDGAPDLVITGPGDAPALDAGAVRSVRTEDLVAAPGRGGDPRATDPEDLLYLIHTSGSSGRPKGVRIPRRAAAAALAALAQETRLGQGDTLLAMTTIGFDIAVFELLGPLVAGAAVRIATGEEVADPARLVTLLARPEITIAQATPSRWRMLLDAGFAPRPGLRLLCGGEALDQDLAARLAVGGGLWNVYGPTETTIWSTIARVDCAPITLGLPIAGTQVRVVDGRGRPVPFGSAGELWIGGAGLALGYHRRPEIEAARFVVEGSGTPARRWYRTGDQVRQRPDGTLIWVGRLDDQVKIRGHRVEPAEVEAAILASGLVQEAAVAGGRAPGGGTELRAWIVPASRAQDDAARDEALSAWRTIWDTTFLGPGVEDGPGRDRRGWVDSRTGLPLPEASLLARAGEVAALVTADGAESVLEIGCGGGLLTFVMAPRVRRLVALDISTQAVQSVDDQACRLGLTHVEAAVAPAHDLSLLGGQRFDAVVLNSVVQYFPDEAYLGNALDAALARVRPGGRLVIGDVRNLSLLEAFHLWVALSEAADTERAAAVRDRVERRVRSEPELVVAPEYFSAWAAGHPGIRIEHLGPESGGGGDELRRFRYDVVLRSADAGTIGPAGRPPCEPIMVDGRGRNLAGIEAEVSAAGDVPVVVRGVGNARTAGLRAVLNALSGGSELTAHGLREIAGDSAPAAVDPDELIALGRKLRRPVAVTWSHTGGLGAVDLVLGVPGGTSTGSPLLTSPVGVAGPAPPITPHTNQPAHVREEGALVEAVRAALRRRLPEAFVPARFLVLARLPRLPGGKTDRRHLPEPGSDDTAPATDPPHAGLEEQVAAIWRELLGVTSIGRSDDFFALGGHSLLATRLAARINTRFGIEIPLRAFFAAPTVAGVAAAIAAAQPEPAPPAGSIRTDLAAAAGPVLSPGQERLWFLHQLDPASPAYAMAAAVRLRGVLDRTALELALADVLCRHEALRTVVIETDGRPCASLLASGPFPLRVQDCEALPDSARTGAIDAVAASEAAEPFDLTRGPLVRGVLLRFSNDDHGLVLVLHHIAADGWSLAILARDLSSAYAARRRGRPWSEGTPAEKWSVLARDQRERANSDAGRRLIEEWKEQLRAAPPHIDIPTDTVRPQFQAHRGRTLRLEIPLALDVATISAARRLGATPFAIRLATFKVLLHRLTECVDIIVGTTVSLRTRPGTEDVVGFRVNTLPLRTDLGGDPSFAEAVRRVQETLNFALGRADVPFASLVPALGVPRDPSRNPVFQVCFDDFEVPAAEFALEGIEAGIRPVDSAASKFDLGFRIERSGNGTRLAMEWDTGLFEPATMEAWGRAWIAILGSALQDAGAAVSQLPLLDDGDRRTVLALGTGPRVDLPWATFVEAFESVARKHPHRPALIAEGRIIGYEALLGIVGTLARRIRSAGAVKGDLVAVFLSRSPDLVSALAGVLRAGCAFVPLDPAGPPGRIDDVLLDSRPRLIVTSEALAPRLAGTATPILLVDDATRDPGCDPLPPFPTPEDLAYVLHTSGSTGRPKGVMVTHRGLANYVAWAAETYHAGSGAGTPFHTSVAYDLSITSLFVPLAAGGTVILAAEGSGLEGLSKLLRPGGDLTLLKLTPSHLDGVSAASAQGHLRGAARTWVVGGEALRYEDLRRLRAESATSRIVNEYGPTEATVGCCAHEVAGSEPDSGPVPIGRPIWNTVARVLDIHGDPVPAGVPGELFAGGAGLARGYLGQPDLTQRTFVQDPFGPRGTLLYRTGDIVRTRWDGVLFFLGRRDEQVKIRGVRVEPEETRAAIRALPGVRDAAVLSRPGSGGVLRLVAWVVADAGVDPPAWPSILRARLPEAFIPAAFVRVDSLPLTPHGKLDVRALPEPPDPAAAATRSAVPPSTPAEVALAAAWEEVLGVRTPGRHDDFFALGGDSILSLRVVARFRARGFALRPRDVFLHPTLTEMAAAASPDLAPAAPDAPSAVGDVVPLLPTQRWLLDLGMPAPHHWNQALFFEVGPGIPKALVRAALEAVAGRHDAFRLRFLRVEGIWQAVLAAEPAVAWTERDLHDVPPAHRQAAMDAASATAQARLDLANGPLMGSVWFESEPGEPARLLWFAHHLVVDGVSWRILGEDLSDALLALRAGRKPDPARVPMPLPAFAGRCAVRTSAGDFTASTEAWAGELAGTNEPWPDAGGGFGTEGDAVVVDLIWDPGTTGRILRPASSAARTTPPDLLLAALALAIRDTGAPGPWVIDVESHGRDGFSEDLDLSRTVGWLTAIHPLRLEAVADDDALAVLCYAKSRRRRLPDSGSFGAVAWSSGESPAPGRREVPGLAAVLKDGRPRQILFNYLGQAGATAAARIRLLPATPGPHRAPVNPRTHLLEIDALVSEGILKIRWTGDGRILDHRRLTDLVECFRAHLGGLLDAARAEGARALVPEDFPLARIDATGLAAILAADPDPADIFPLTPTQQGMFFHGLHAPESPAYLEQVAHVFEGGLDATVLREAYDRVLARHDLFRSRISWRGLSEPHFVIGRRLALPWSFLDWSGLPAAAGLARLRDHLAEDRRLGLNLEDGPLFRITLARLGPDRYALSFTWHHVLLDGWSLPLLMRDVLAAYEALRAGQILALGPALPYRDYVAHLQQQDPDAQRAFWRARLSGFAEPTEIALHPAPAPDEPMAVDFAERESTLAPDLVRRLEARCRELGLTSAVFAQGAWALAIGRWSSSEDVVFGLTVGGRPPELRGSADRIGLFINTVPVRVGLPASETSASWLRSIQHAQADRAAYELTPLPLSQAQSNVPAGTPLFESLLVFENYPVEAALREAPGGFRLLQSQGFERTSYPVTAVVVPGPPFVLRILSDRARLPDDAAARLLDIFVRTVTDLLMDPGRCLGEIPSLEPGEITRLRDLGAGQDFAVPPADVVDRVRDQARRRPDGCAVTDGSSLISLAEIDRIADVLAMKLRPHLRKAAPVVALLASRGMGAVTAMLGILRAGAAWLPVDPGLPADRRRMLIEDADAVAIVTTGEPVLDPDSDLPMIAVPDATPDPSPASQPTGIAPGHTAYVIHTSGSTGRPKAVAIGRASLAAFTDWAINAYGLGPGDRVLHFASLGFDTSVEEIWPALAAGATIAVRGADDAASGEAFAGGLRRLRPTVVDLPAGFWNELVPALRPGHIDAWESVRLLILGGEAASPRALRRWRRLFGRRIRILNTYGPTEATVVATVADLTGDLGDAVPDPVPIGRPRAGAEVLVADASGRPLPEGVPGELLIGGGCLADGYLGDEELTARRFVDHPLRPGERVYRTGDRVRWRPDGQLEYLGRLDGQVKVRGQRVEPAEVEAALARHPAVAGAAVVADGGGAARRLFAFIKLKPGVECPVDDVLAAARRHLPAAWVPARCTVVAEIPRLTSGKIDRRRLAASATRQEVPPREESLPTDGRITLLCRLFEEVLETQPVGPHDGFLALGGHSLTALRLLARIHAELGREPPIRILLENPTPASLAAFLELPSGDVATMPGPRDAGVGPGIDLRAEAVLPEDIRPASAGPPAIPPHRVLLTGTTGFLGAHLLTELLAAGHEVTALVRAPNEEEARRRIGDAARRFSLPAPSRAPGLRSVAGAIDRPNLGVDAATYESFVESTDAIVHAAAAMSFFASYRDLRPANVQGTIGILALAASGPPKALHYLSTSGLLVSAAAAAADESTPLDRPEFLHGGYLQSKWVAEALVREAGRRGMAVTVHRPGLIVGHSQTGAVNPDDFAHRLLSACLALGLVPDLEIPFDPIPVDVAARAIVVLLGRSDSSGRTYHLFETATPSSKTVLGLLREAGAKLEAVPPGVWRREFLDEFRMRPDDPRSLLVPFVAAAPARLLPPALDRRFTAAASMSKLAELGIRIPRPDVKWFSKVIARIQRPL